MTNLYSSKGSRLEKIFLSERFMGIVCASMVAAGLISLVFCLKEGDSFETFALLAKLATAAAMFLAFRSLKWDAAKGLLGGVLFCLMYQEAHLALGNLWQEGNFDTYLVAGVQGSLFLAGAGMNLLMTVIITLNHFFINYSTRGNPKNVILNRIALVFKFAVWHSPRGGQQPAGLLHKSALGPCHTVSVGRRAFAAGGLPGGAV